MKEIFLKRMQSILGNQYNDFLVALNQEPKKAFYLNQKKINAIDILDQLKIKAHPYIKNGFYYDSYEYALGKSPYYHCGLYYIQEPSAMVVGDLLDVKPNDYILDMCAAPGGKTCQVAMKLSDQGLMIANDITSMRASILSQNVERMGLTNTIVTNTDPIHFDKIFQGYFDKIILDAPCSGEGMFRKLDKAIETWSIDKVNECAYIQKKLVDSAFKMLKEGGLLIYSTCTYSIEENEAIVEYACQNFDFETIHLTKQKGMVSGINHDDVIRLYPHINYGEGHFIALLQKKASTKTKKIKLIQTNISNDQLKLVQKFYHTYLNLEVPKNLYCSNDHVYAIKPHFPMMEKTKILRTGLHLGICKKGRFEPSHALALTLQPNDVKQAYYFNVGSLEVQKYLQGHTLEGTNQKGYGVIFVDNFPLAFYKESNQQVKNLYPKGLRRP